MSEPPKLNDQQVTGESVRIDWTYTWIDPKRIEAGELLAPVKLSSELAGKFAAMHLVLEDLNFALESFEAADRLGIPNVGELHSKALIFSGVVAYARCFGSGVRERVDFKSYQAQHLDLDEEIHEYLMALRNKHVAHSVNSFEVCTAIAMIVGDPQKGWREASAIGVSKQLQVGITATQLKKAVEHLSKLRSYVASTLEVQRLKLYDEFRAEYAAGKQFPMAPLYAVADRDRVSERCA